jgi:hypothetical protein
MTRTYRPSAANEDFLNQDLPIIHILHLKMDSIAQQSVINGKVLK